jgi:hypothetical protein
MGIGGEGGSANTYTSPTRTQMWPPWLNGPGAQEGEYAQRDGLGWVAGKLSFTP